MKLSTFVLEYEDLKDEAIKKHLLHILNQLTILIEVNNDDFAKDLMVAGLLDSWIDIENEDLFGTEGLIRE